MKAHKTLTKRKKPPNLGGFFRLSAFFNYLFCRQGEENGAFGQGGVVGFVKDEILLAVEGLKQHSVTAVAFKEQFIGCGPLAAYLTIIRIGNAFAIIPCFW